LTRKVKKKAKEEKLHCPQCGAEVSPSDEFCECGNLLLVEENIDAYADAQDLEEDN